MKDSSQLMLSIIVLSYNHEKYIEQALNSIICQKVNFEYEILIGDDCSTDSTQSIIRQYVQQYPTLFKATLRTKNIGGRNNLYDLISHAHGKYIAYLESDDYWCDDNKLQKQIDFLEKNKEYIGCAHKFSVINKNGDIYYDRDFEIQFIKTQIYTLKDFEKGKLISHLNSLVHHNIYLEKETDFFHILIEVEGITGDMTINLILILIGKMYCMNDNMSRYRKITDSSSSSFSAVQEKENKRDKLYKSLIDLEKIIKAKFNKRVNFSKRKLNVFASAVFKYQRDKTKHNKEVVTNIINLSDQKIRYRLFEKYLLLCKKILWLIFREDRRVPF